MLAKRLVYIALVAGSLSTALVVSGCNSEKKLIGKYKADVKLSAKEQADLDKNPFGAMAKSMMGSMALELKDEHKFTLTIMIPIEGTWSVSGDTLELKPETVMGMKADEVKKKQEEAAAKNPALMAQAKNGDLTKTLKFTVGSDGTLTAVPDGSSTDKGTLTFKKEATN